MANTKKQIEPKSQPSKADQIYLAVLNGLPLWRIEQQVNNMANNKKEREQILLDVRARFEASAFIDPIVVKGFCVSALQEIYAKLMREGDYQGAIKSLKEYNRVSNSEINESLTEAETDEDEE